MTILQILSLKMPRPDAYGWFHLLCIGLTVGLSVLACLRGKHNTAKTVGKIVFLTAVLVAAFEIYKQVQYTFGDGSKAPAYQWYIFPWQFCSTPMYIGLLTGVFKKGKIHDALYAYLATYAMFAGLCVMVYPGDVFTKTIGINIQTMVCHGSMVVIGVYLLASGQVKANWRTLLSAMAVFSCCVGIAMGLNEIAYRSGLLENHVFNMFFISPYCAPSLPVYSLVQQVVPYPFCLIIYVGAFSAAAGIMLLLAVGIRRLAESSHIARPVPVLR